MFPISSGSAHNAPSYRACIQLLSSLSGYQYTRRAWKKEAFDLFMDHTFFQMDSSCVSQWVGEGTGVCVWVTTSTACVNL